MDLPLDHFRLLGVSPATDAQTVLRTLQLRLDRAPEQGYTVETLQARAELLRASADLLSDSERRTAYESDLTALAAAEEPLMPALEIPSSREVAGLLLLLEAGQPLEAFQLASRALQPPQAPALGSGREADLTLLAGEAALAAASEQSRERHYELAAGTLQQSLQLLQRMGQMPELRHRIHDELEALAPFRVLDLLSRDPAAVQERQEGLALLEQLVQRRGGLEGHQDERFAPEDFQTFFKQIRSFLTVQEQLDLFQGWGKQGSPAAAFLHTIALTASGFAQRKPERIATAREQLRSSGRDGLEPLLANLDLLLGDVEGAIGRFNGGAGPELRAWAETQSSDPLAQVCAWCRDWLSRDVLPGYRDLDADADLEAYFSDRDVLAWVEREDRRSGRSFEPSAAAAPQGPSVPAPGPLPGEAAFGDGFPSFDTPWGREAGLTTIPPLTAAAADLEAPARERRPRRPSSDQEEIATPWRLPFSLDWARRLSDIPLGLAGAAALALLLLAGVWQLRPRAPRPAASVNAPLTGPATGRPAATPAASSATAASAPAAPVGSASVSAPTASATTGTAGGPLTSSEPSEAELQSLLERWLKAKSTVLAGGATPPGLSELARDTMLSQLARQRSLDRGRNQSQSIDVAVRSLTIRERAPRRIAVTADLAYSDTTRDSAGKVVARTAPTSLRNVYVFGRDGDTWRLAASRPAG